MELTIQLIGYNGTRSAIMRAQRQQARLDAPDTVSVVVDEDILDRLKHKLDDDAALRELLRSHIRADVDDVLCTGDGSGGTVAAQ